MTVERTVELCFGNDARATGTHTNLSAVRSDGPVVWVAGDETATIEGLARYGHFLWAIGSHSLRRRRIKSRHRGDKALRRLATVTGQANRQLLLRLPVADVDGPPTLVRELALDGEVHRAAGFGAHGTDLRDLLGDDEHLAPFLLGVRDLCPQGPDLLVLAGPTMDLDGPVHVFRWHDACAAQTPQVVRGDLLTRAVDLPYGVGADHAEGIGLLGEDRLLVVYDSPAPARLTTDGVLADVVRLP